MSFRKWKGKDQPQVGIAFATSRVVGTRLHATLAPYQLRVARMNAGADEIEATCQETIDRIIPLRGKPNAIPVFNGRS
jgi:hypothetical protein